MSSSPERHFFCPPIHSDCFVRLLASDNEIPDFAISRIPPPMSPLVCGQLSLSFYHHLPEPTAHISTFSFSLSPLFFCLPYLLLHRCVEGTLCSYLLSALPLHVGKGSLGISMVLIFIAALPCADEACCPVPSFCSPHLPTYCKLNNEPTVALRYAHLLV